MKYITPERFFNRAVGSRTSQSVVYGKKIGKHIIVGVDNVTSPDRPDELLLIPQITKLFNKTREIYGAPLMITAGDRTIKHQRKLLKLGLKGATVMSPHILGAALDIDAVPSTWDTEKQACERIIECVNEAAQEIKVELPRMGFKAYNYRFVHVDLVFILFEPFTKIEHPGSWLGLFKNLGGQIVKGAHDKFSNSWRPGVTW